jgi:hypothetical protein
VLVPDEFREGAEQVTCEVFENSRWQVTERVWASADTPSMASAERGRFSDRTGANNSSEFPEWRLPAGYRWVGPWRLDETYTQADAEGWSYAPNWVRRRRRRSRPRGGRRPPNQTTARDTQLCGVASPTGIDRLCVRRSGSVASQQERDRV